MIGWLAVVLVGGWASRRLSALESNVFSVPGTDSEHVRHVLSQHFGDRSDGAFMVVFRVQNSADPALKARLQRVVDEAAKAVPTGKGTALAGRRPARPLRHRDLDAQPRRTPRATPTTWSRRVGQPAGTPAYVTGAPAIQNDLDPIFSKDLQKGESIALPIALLVLLLVFGLSLGGDDPVPVRRQHGLRDARASSTWSPTT